MGLAAFGCVAGQTQPDRLFPLVVLAFGLVAGVLFLLCTWMLVLVSSGRRRRKLAKILVALGAGSVCGALWILFVDTVVNVAIPAAMNEPAVLVVGVVTALVAATLLSMPNRLSKVVGLSAMAAGTSGAVAPAVCPARCGPRVTRLTAALLDLQGESNILSSAGVQAWTG
jgi:hypothetical protein